MRKIGTSRADLLLGSTEDDYLNGGSGSDHIVGNAGNDMLIGGSGHDTIVDDQGDNTAFGGSGNDTVLLGNGDNTVKLDAGNDHSMTGFTLVTDWWVDDNGVEHFYTWYNPQDGGDNTVDGGSGNDVLEDGDGSSRLIGGSGHDYVFGGGGDDEISGGSGNDTAFGGEGDDIVTGDAGNDILGGNGGVDEINGGAGNDIIYAGLADTVLGGSGKDMVYLFAEDGNGGSLITRAVEVIDLSGLGLYTQTATGARQGFDLEDLTYNGGILRVQDDDSGADFDIEGFGSVMAQYGGSVEAAVNGGALIIEQVYVFDDFWGVG